MKLWFDTCCCCTLSIITDYLMLTNAINSFQETKPCRMEQTGDGTFLKSLFTDQVMGSSWSHPNNVLKQCPVENLLVFQYFLCYGIYQWMVECCFMNYKCIIIIDPVFKCFKLLLLQINEHGRIDIWRATKLWQQHLSLQKRIHPIATHIFWSHKGSWQ